MALLRPQSKVAAIEILGIPCGARGCLACGLVDVRGVLRLDFGRARHIGG